MIISDTVDITTATGVDTFIRALVQVTIRLTACDLGTDPTVDIAGEGAMGDATIPQFCVGMPSGSMYVTIGTPIWQSSTLFGRGTTVWDVLQQKDRQNDVSADDSSATYILKTSYRDSRRITESSFYDGIGSLRIPGLAVFKEGGDVKLSGAACSVDGDVNATSEGFKIPVVNLLTNSVHRKGLAESFKADLIVHRLVLVSRGRRLNEYSSVLEVLQAVLESIKGQLSVVSVNLFSSHFDLGHETLYNNGILHRDISIGNVFISTDPRCSHGAVGFLGDLDMAKFYEPIKLSEVIGVEKTKQLVKESNSGGVTVRVRLLHMASWLIDILRERHNSWLCHY